MELITLENKDTQKIIKDVVMHPCKVNEDSSGVLVETMRKDWIDIYGKEREFFMQYYSETPGGMARDEDVWLNQDFEEGRLTDLFVPYATDKMEAYPVSSLVNSAKN